MSRSRTDDLMHAVLDGEATPAEAHELEQRLAADPQARGRYAELQHLFDGLRRIPKRFPPEGLVASVLANIPQNPGDAERGDQLFATSGVLEASSRKARGRPSGRSEWVRQVFQPWAISRG